jgi:hypothetical protein
MAFSPHANSDKENAMRRLSMMLLGATGMIAVMSTGASAAIICNDDGDCWQTTETYTYPPDARVHVYADDYVIDKKKYKMREVRPGRGYWRGGVWVGF